MSANPRYVLTDTTVSWGEPGCTVFVRARTVVDIPPGSTLETAYGGSGNLSGVIPAGQRGDGTCLSKACLAN